MDSHTTTHDSLWFRLLPLMAVAALVVAIMLAFAERAPGATTVVVLKNGDTRCANGCEVPAGQIWRFDPNSNVTIQSTGSVIVRGTLEMKPKNGNITHILRFTGVNEKNFKGGGMGDDLAVVASDVGLWVLDAGKLNLQGEAKPAWSYTYQSAWAGDEVLAAPNKPNSYGFTKVTSTPAKNALGYATELLNLTRNVRVEGTTSGYTHVFIRPTSPAPSIIKNVQFRYVGPDAGNFTQGYDDGKTGRYGLHIHMGDNNTRGTVVDGVVIRDTKNHAFVPHLSNGVTIKNSIGYNIRGEGLWWDEGDTANDLMVDRLVLAGIRKASEGKSHRLGAFYLGLGSRVTVKNSVVVGFTNDEGGADRSGFLWPEGDEATWGFTNNRAHNNETHGIFVWQNNDLPHVIDGFIAYYNEGAGIEHGAYLNAYVYKNLDLRGNGNPVTSLALGKGASNTDTQVWANVKTGGGNLVIEEHALAGKTPVRFVNCDFSKVIVNESSGDAASTYDFINCGLEPGDFSLGGAKSSSVFRVQRANGTAFRLTGNGSVTNISKFYNGTIPATPSSGGTPTADNPFIDDDGNVFENDIKWLFDKGITKGCATGRFCPNDRVTRAQMAAFLVRAMKYTSAGKGNFFSDDNGSIFENDIDKLANSGVTKGCAAKKFCPNNYVTRAQMAAFLVRAMKYTSAGKGNYFSDDNGSMFETDIDKLRVSGVTLGCNPPANTKYCPNEYVTRGQMAAFLHRALSG